MGAEPQHGDGRADWPLRTAANGIAAMSRRGSVPPGGYVVTLLASTLPLDDVVARLSGALFAKAFCERRVVDGHTRYRLQLGPFASAELATEVLKQARRMFPRAVIRPAGTRQGPQDAAQARSAAAADVDRSAARTALVELSDSFQPGLRFAVELVWSPDPIDLRYVPPLTLFDGRTLYAVSVRRADHLWYGLRVGFYDTRADAHPAAVDLAAYFSGAVVVPATERELEHARSAEILGWAARIDPAVAFAA